VYGSYQDRNRPGAETTSNRPVSNNSNDPASKKTNTLPYIPSEKPTNRFYRKYNEASNHANGSSEIDVIYRVKLDVLLYDSSGKQISTSKLPQLQFSTEDWIDYSGMEGILYIYANDQAHVYKEKFYQFKPIASPKTPIASPRPPARFSRVGPVGWFAYQIGGWDAVNAVIRGEEKFSEASRVYFTYDFPLSSSVFKIATGITGKEIDSNKTLSSAERVKNIVLGVIEIFSLAGGSSASFVDDLFESIVWAAIKSLLEEKYSEIINDVQDAQTFDGFIEDVKSQIRQLQQSKIK
jgi:hypothetical protein